MTHIVNTRISKVLCFNGVRCPRERGIAAGADKDESGNAAANPKGPVSACITSAG